MNSSTDSHMSKERRFHRRYNASDGAFAAISPNSFKMGQIVNISRGGLAFQYIDRNRGKQNAEEKSIFLSSKGYYVQGISFRTVSDCPIQSDNPFSSVKMRQCSIQFCDMTFDQIINLDNYIINNTDQYKAV